MRNRWESEDGPSLKSLCGRAYFWDGPWCWIDARTLAVWGYGRDDEWLIPAALVFDVVSGHEIRWFPGPEIAPKNEIYPEERRPVGWFEFDEYLFSVSPERGTAVWDVVTGERLLEEPDFRPRCYHRGARRFLSLPGGATWHLSLLVGAATS
jgi:hypothetical protein